MLPFRLPSCGHLKRSPSLGPHFRCEDARVHLAGAMNKPREARPLRAGAIMASLCAPSPACPSLRWRLPRCPKQTSAALADNEVAPSRSFTPSTARSRRSDRCGSRRARSGPCDAALGERMAQHEDARCTLLIGRGVLGHGHALDNYAFPAFALPPTQRSRRNPKTAFVFGKLLQFGTNSASQVLAVRNGVETMESQVSAFA